ncbi:hypothetical protein [Sphingomonas aerolata]|uniref:hypothetical protein n=1 Tax=Sphingomonas aerolata TaxID=185951 RepID=UPI002FE191E5
MSRLVNPMDAMKTFEPALRSGELRTERGRVDPELIVHADTPNGQMRISYARLGESSVRAMAIIIPAEFENGLPVFQIGYAVPQHLRKRGLGKDIAQAAIAEFTSGVARGGLFIFILRRLSV